MAATAENVAAVQAVESAMEQHVVISDERAYVAAVRLTGVQIAQAVTDGLIDRAFQLAAALVKAADKRGKYLAERVL